MEIVFEFDVHSPTIVKIPGNVRLFHRNQDHDQCGQQTYDRNLTILVRLEHEIRQQSDNTDLNIAVRLIPVEAFDPSRLLKNREKK